MRCVSGGVWVCMECVGCEGVCVEGGGVVRGYWGVWGGMGCVGRYGVCVRCVSGGLSEGMYGV